MYNTTRMISFAVASILLFLVYPLIQDVTYIFIAFTFGRYLPTTISAEIYQSFLFIFSFLGFAIFQSVTRHFQLKRYEKENTVMGYPIASFYIGDRLVYYIVPFFIYILPIFRQSFLTEIILLRVGLFILTILFFEALLRYSQANTHAKFLKDGIVVKGKDIRLDFPLTGRVVNMSGFYPYENIDSYQIDDATVEFKLRAESGKIVINFPPEDRSEIKDFLKMIKIPHGSSKK